MEELTEPLRKALEKGEPVRLRDPGTARVYVLVRAEVFDRLTQDEGIPVAIRESKSAFLRDLPSLLQNSKYDRWSVAYCGNERIGIAESEKEVIEECLKRGLKRDQYYIGVVAPYDHEGEIERSLYEFDPIKQ
jgi:hypothetical protein